MEIRDADGVPVGTGRDRRDLGARRAGRRRVPRESRTSWQDGWFPTADGGSIDADGYLYLEGRLDDVIVRGAENMSPGEIEDVLVAHPSVVDAGVVGVPDTEWGEKVVAAVVVAEGSSATEEELQAWVKSQLRSSKTPQHIEFRETLPYNDTGKLLRRVLKSELADAYGTTKA